MAEKKLNFEILGIFRESFLTQVPPSAIASQIPQMSIKRTSALHPGIDIKQGC